MDFKQKWRDRLYRMVVADHVLYPQYAGYFDAWVLTIARTQEVLVYKGGSRLTDGRWVLASPDLMSWYDPDNGFICSVKAGVLVKV